MNYSTLEEAWGENFNKPKKSKKQEIDPICKLYNKRLNKVYPPYKISKDDDEPSYKKVNYIDKNHEKYYGFRDGRPYSRKYKKITKKPVDLRVNAYDSEEENDYLTVKKKKQPKKKSYSLPVQQEELPSKKFIHPDEEEFIMNNLIDDEEYVEEESKYISEPKYIESDEEFDDYLDSDEESNEEYQKILQEDVDSEEEEESPFKVINKKKKFKKNDKHYLDMGIYTISGIILIFIMEQFIQIGMKLKSKTI
jgi:hypothetical protein